MSSFISRNSDPVSFQTLVTRCLTSYMRGYPYWAYPSDALIFLYIDPIHHYDDEERVSNWGRKQILTSVPSFVFSASVDRHWAASRVVCLKYHIILCNSVKTFSLLTYRGFERFDANTHDPKTRRYTNPRYSDKPKRLRWRLSPAHETNLHNTYGVQGFRPS